MSSLDAYRLYALAVLAGLLWLAWQINAAGRRVRAETARIEAEIQQELR